MTAKDQYSVRYLPNNIEENIPTDAPSHGPRQKAASAVPVESRKSGIANSPLAQKPPTFNNRPAKATGMTSRCRTNSRRAASFLTELRCCVDISKTPPDL